MDGDLGRIHPPSTQADPLKPRTSPLARHDNPPTFTPSTGCYNLAPRPFPSSSPPNTGLAKRHATSPPRWPVRLPVGHVDAHRSRQKTLAGTDRVLREENPAGAGQAVLQLPLGQGQDPAGRVATGQPPGGRPGWRNRSGGASGQAGREPVAAGTEVRRARNAAQWQTAKVGYRRLRDLDPPGGTGPTNRGDQGPTEEADQLSRGVEVLVVHSTQEIPSPETLRRVGRPERDRSVRAGSAGNRWAEGRPGG